MIDAFSRTVTAGDMAQLAFLNARQFRTLEAFAEVFLEGEDERLTPAEIATNIDGLLGEITSKRKRTVALSLFLVEYLLPLARLRFRRFSSLPPAERRLLVAEYVVNPRRRTALRNLARLKTLILAGYYGDIRTHPSTGFIEVPDRPGFSPRPPNLGPATLPLLQPEADQLETDVCVIGSGAGGAVIAARASAAGRDVIVLEEGAAIFAPQIVPDERIMSPRVYKEGGLQTSVDLELSILQGRCLGGSTTINNCISFRVRDPALHPDRNRDLFQRWEALGARIDETVLDAAYASVESRIGVERIVDNVVGSSGHALLRGHERLVAQGQLDSRSSAGIFRKNYVNLRHPGPDAKLTCLGCGYCNFACPYGRKLSMVETYLRDAVESGRTRLIVECHAEGIEHHGRQAVAVRARLRNGRAVRIKAKQIVVAAGAIGSSVLLLKSGIRRNVGTRFSVNIASPVIARFDTPQRSFLADQMTAFVDTGDCIFESSFDPPLAFSARVPGWFGDHFERMRAYDRMVSAGVVLGTEPNGRVKRCGLIRDLFGPVEYVMTPSDFARLRRGIATLAWLYFASGAVKVYPSSFVDLPLVKSQFGGPDDIDRHLAGIITSPQDLTLNTSHPQGGNPMSDRADIGAVDTRFRVHGFDNLLVCDASIFPTSLSVNPQVTIMAMAEYAAMTGCL
jgi:choline dehydrogenase-like flavoprotein